MGCGRSKATRLGGGGQKPDGCVHNSHSSLVLVLRLIPKRESDPLKNLKISLFSVASLCASLRKFITNSVAPDPHVHRRIYNRWPPVPVPSQLEPPYTPSQSP
jgi:hypothetical protein